MQPETKESTRDPLTIERTYFFLSVSLLFRVANLMHNNRKGLAPPPFTDLFIYYNW